MLRYDQSGENARIQASCPGGAQCPRVPHVVPCEGWEGVCDGLGTVTMRFPAKLAMCWRCDGRGRHMNEATDHVRIQSDAIDFEPFETTFRAGLYDVVCTHCDGKKKAPALDWDRMTPSQLLFMLKWQAGEIQTAPGPLSADYRPT